MIASIVFGFLIIDWWNYLIQINISAWYNERKLGQDKMTERKKENKKGLVAPIGATEIDITLISEDIHQPRKEFNQETLRELTETIKLRGVKSPISVRPNPDKPGTYIINHGARRYRASINAGLTKIPAFIDTDYSESDQVIENLQRDDLTSREIADFIGRQLAGGKTKSERSEERRVGKECRSRWSPYH